MQSQIYEGEGEGDKQNMTRNIHFLKVCVWLVLLYLRYVTTRVTNHLIVSHDFSANGSNSSDSNKCGAMS